MLERQQKKINNKTYEKKIDVLDKKDSKAYAEYTNHIENSFSSEQIKKALKTEKGQHVDFMSKQFINRLAKAENQGKKNN